MSNRKRCVQNRIEISPASIKTISNNFDGCFGKIAQTPVLWLDLSQLLNLPHLKLSLSAFYVFFLNVLKSLKGFMIMYGGPGISKISNPF